MLGTRSSNAWRLDTACCVIDFSPFHDSVTPQRIHGGHRATSPAESFRLQVFDHSPFGQGKCSDIPNTRLLWHHETGSRPRFPFLMLLRDEDDDRCVSRYRSRRKPRTGGQR
jgi:hypothetical protein